MSHVYGKDIAHKVRAFAGETPVAIHSLVSARLYADTPTEAQRHDDAAALGGFTGTAKSSWSSSSVSDLTYTVTFDAVDDADVNSESLYDRWHPVVNVRLQAAGQVQALYKPILIWRVVPQFSQMDVDEDDVYAVEGEIDAVLGDTETLKKVALAKTRVFSRIKSLGLDRHRLQEVDLGEAVVYKAAALCLWDMSTSSNNYGDKAARWDEEYSRIWSGLKPGYDADGHGVIDPEEKRNTAIRGMRVRI